jgi:HK97 family phage major capsid protein
LAYITNAKVRGKLKQTMRNGTYGEMPIWADGGTPLNGYPAFVTNQVSSTLTKGSSNVASAIFFGNWSDLVLGMWGEMDMLVDPYTFSSSGAVRVVAFQDVDFGVRHAESFAAMLDALTA